MDYEAVRIGNVTVPQENVLLFEINGIDVKNYSIPEIKKLYHKPNIKLKFRNSKDAYLYCKDADMLFIFAYDDFKKYMLEFELPYKIGMGNINRCEITKFGGDETYIELDKYNIYSYINSNAIAEHCQKIGHRFSSAECAYITDASKNHTIAEKHAMFNHIIETMPDEEIKLRGNGGHHTEVSLHKTLKKYMEIENKTLKELYTADDNHIYDCDVYYCEDASRFSRQYGPYKELSDFWSKFKEDNLSKVTKIRVIKRNLSTQRESTFTLNSEKQPVFCGRADFSDKEGDDVAGMFDLMEFVFPTPFKKGDIVSYHCARFTEEFVLESISYEGMSTKSYPRRDEYGQCSEMMITGYFQKRGNNKIYRMVYIFDSNFLSLEYYNGKIEGKLRILKALSKYFKGEIPLDFFLKAYDIILMEESLGEAKGLPKWFEFSKLEEELGI